ncbi:hypothetical protein [Roseovarius salis]|uniref:hypothetical protein n=1 Tax=Roseovarius salis TaxID=3376063 RepID=UPI0037C69C80
MAPLALAEPLSGRLSTGERLSFSIVAGKMTNNGFDEVLLPYEVDFAKPGFAGLILGYEVPLEDPRWEIGVEVQANRHFGRGTYQEFVVPATIRYSPARPWWPVIDSFAFGLGLSYTTQTPPLEIARRGDSQRAMVYFSLETAFSLNQPEDSVFLRLHHRSDAYGLFATNSGSNAFAIGFRRGF